MKQKNIEIITHEIEPGLSLHCEATFARHEYGDQQGALVYLPMNPGTLLDFRAAYIALIVETMSQRVLPDAAGYMESRRMLFNQLMHADSMDKKHPENLAEKIRVGLELPDPGFCVAVFALSIFRMPPLCHVNVSTTNGSHKVAYVYGTEEAGPAAHSYWLKAPGRGILPIEKLYPSTNDDGLYDRRKPISSRICIAASKNASFGIDTVVHRTQLANQHQSPEERNALRAGIFTEAWETGVTSLLGAVIDLYIEDTREKIRSDRSDGVIVF